MIALALIVASVIAMAVHAALADRRAAAAEDRALTCAAAAGALRHDLHAATAHAARQARTIEEQHATIDALSTAMLGLNAQLVDTMIRAGEALAAAEMEIEAPLPTLGFMADELTRDRISRGVL